MTKNFGCAKGTAAIIPEHNQSSQTSYETLVIQDGIREV